MGWGGAFTSEGDATPPACGLWLRLRLRPPHTRIAMKVGYNRWLFSAFDRAVTGSDARQKEPNRPGKTRPGLFSSSASL